MLQCAVDAILWLSCMIVSGVSLDSASRRPKSAADASLHPLRSPAQLSEPPQLCFVQVSPRLVGLALAHVLNLSGSMQWAVRQTAEAENNVTSVERMLRYTRLPAEVPPRVAEGGGTPPPAWPAGGRLVFESISARYRPGLPPVLSDISFTLEVLPSLILPKSYTE